MAAKTIKRSAQMLGIRPVKTVPPPRWEAVKGSRGPKGKLLGMRPASEAVKGIRK